MEATAGGPVVTRTQEDLNQLYTEGGVDLTQFASKEPQQHSNPPIFRSKRS